MPAEKYQFAYGEKAMLARAADLSLVHIYQILQGRKRPSAAAAEMLERATAVLEWCPKVHRLAWLYPDQYDNPLINPDDAEPEEIDPEDPQDPADTGVA